MDDFLLFGDDESLLSSICEIALLQSLCGFRIFALTIILIFKNKKL